MFETRTRQFVVERIEASDFVTCRMVDTIGPSIQSSDVYLITVRKYNNLLNQGLTLSRGQPLK